MGPLEGMKILEVGGIGAAPFCGYMLSDMGADILRIDFKGRPRSFLKAKYDVLYRNRRSISIDLKNPAGVKAVLRLIEQSEALIEGFRPGVMERLGIGPEVCFKRNPRLVFGRMTGWGQEGPLSQAAGHDINYIALAGTLHAIGRPGEKPVPPINLIGDFGGGGMLLAFGIMCAVYEVRKSGKGQVVDAAMIDGAAALTAVFYGMSAAGEWSDQHGTNLLDGGAHFYDTYETADGKWVSIGSLEPQFYELLLKYTGIDDPKFQPQANRERWPELKEKIAEVFKSKTRDEWCKIMEGTDVCFAPVLSFEEAVNHPHNIARNTFVAVEEVMQPAPTPRFSRTQPEIKWAPPNPGEHTESALADWGFDAGELKTLKVSGAV